MSQKKSIDSATVLEYLQGVPWWKRLWNRAVRWWKKPQPVLPDIPEPEILAPSKPPEPKRRSDPPLKLPSGEVQTVEDVLREDARMRRKYGPIHIENQTPSKATEPVNIWQLDTGRYDPKLGPISVARSVMDRRFAIVLKSPQGWLFWNGPKQKMFTRLGEGEIWTTANRQAALIAASFIYSNGAAHAKNQKPNKESD